MHISKSLITALALIGSQAAAEDAGPFLTVDLNAQATWEAGCLLTFLIDNAHPSEIESAVFETVLFDQAGQVDRLTLFDFGALPAGRPRVRQFQLDGLACEDLGKVLINGASTCRVDGKDSAICGQSLKLRSSTAAELIG